VVTVVEAAATGVGEVVTVPPAVVVAAATAMAKDLLRGTVSPRVAVVMDHKVQVDMVMELEQGGLDHQAMVSPGTDNQGMDNNDLLAGMEVEAVPPPTVVGTVRIPVSVEVLMVLVLVAMAAVEERVDMAVPRLVAAQHRAEQKEVTSLIRHYQIKCNLTYCS
jgi:hypothetical protein